MSILQKISVVFLFLLVMLQTIGAGWGDSSTRIAELAVDVSPTSVLPEGSSRDELKSSLFNAETIQISDAMVAPIPSFQFTFIGVLGCFLFLIFSFFTSTKVKETTSSFTSSYFHTLFLSIILINAP